MIKRVCMCMCVGGVPFIQGSPTFVPSRTRGTFWGFPWFLCSSDDRNFLHLVSDLHTDSGCTWGGDEAAGRS